MFKSWRTEPVFWIFVRAVVGCAWIYLGAEKLTRLPDFIYNVENYQVVSGPWNAVIGTFVAWVEIVVGVLILLRLMYPAALAVTAGMLLVFIAALSQAWMRGLEVSCGCTPWSAEKQTNYPMGIAINVGLILVIAVMSWVEYKRPRHRFRGRKLKLG